jgi:hypothetical protein
MEFTRTLFGPHDEMINMFENFSIRFFEKIEDDKYRITFRVKEDFIIPETRKISKMVEELTTQNETIRR